MISSEFASGLHSISFSELIFWFGFLLSFLRERELE